MSETPIQAREENCVTLSLEAVRFLSSRHAFQVMVDGVRVVVPALGSSSARPGNILLLPALAAKQILTQPGNRKLRVYSGIKLPSGFPVPQGFEGNREELGGKKVLIITFNGWGDCILVQPVFRALYEKVSETAEPPEITLAGSWVKNFPCKDASFISKIIPNHMTLDELANYDVIVNLVRVNEARGNGRSIKDLYLEALGLGGEDLPPPVIVPDEERVERLKPLINKIRQQIGKRILYLNWRSRFNHKSAPAELFFQVAEKLKGDYHSVLFKDQEEAGIMGREIREHRAPVENLSTWIRDLKDTVAAISLVDAVVSVDTGIVHAAGALGIPCAAVFGPFSPDNHVDSYPSVKGIRSGFEGKTCSGPCGETHRGCREVGFENERHSPCIEILTADDIIEALKGLE